MAVRTAFACVAFFSAIACAQAAQPDGRYITDWIVAGPFIDIPGESILASLGGPGAAHREGEALPGNAGTWRRHAARGSIVNLRSITGYEQDTQTAAAYCEFQSDADQEGYLHVGSSDISLRVWLNGELVGSQRGRGQETLAAETYKVRLKRGTNTCLITCSVNRIWLFGFTFRADGSVQTPAPPLVWNPLAPMIKDGRYVLFSPDWKWKLGDDPQWAAPGFDDSQWEPIPAATAMQLEPGTICWLRIHARFTPESVLLPYAFNSTHGCSAEIFLDGVSVARFGQQGALLDPFCKELRLHQLPAECTLAIRYVSESTRFHLPRIALYRADHVLQYTLERDQPQRFHRFIVVGVFLFLIVFYRTAFWRSPRRQEGFWYCLTLLFACLSVLATDMDQWTWQLRPSSFTWLSLVFALATVLASVAMAHVITHNEIPKRLMAFFTVLAIGAFVAGWLLDTTAIPYFALGVPSLEYGRVWFRYMYPSRKSTRWYMGIGIVLYFTGMMANLADLFFKFDVLDSFFTYSFAYGLLAFMGCMLMYFAREYAQSITELQTLTTELEDRVEQRTQQVRQLTQRVITAQEDERERISRELHDSVAQTLWFAKMEAESQLAKQTPSAKAPQVVELLEHAISEVRTISYGLRPPELDKLGFVQAIAQCAKDFSYKTRITLDYEALGVDNARLTPLAEVNVYRVLQEALNNIRQHANASKVRIRLVGAYPWVILRVEDDGRGFDTAQTPARDEERMGIRGMEERMRLVAGRMALHAKPGEGTRIVFEVPQQEVEK